MRLRAGLHGAPRSVRPRPERTGTGAGARSCRPLRLPLGLGRRPRVPGGFRTGSRFAKGSAASPPRSADRFRCLRQGRTRRAAEAHPGGSRGGGLGGARDAVGRRGHDLRPPLQPRGGSRLLRFRDPAQIPGRREAGNDGGPHPGNRCGRRWPATPGFWSSGRMSPMPAASRPLPKCAARAASSR